MDKSISNVRAMVTGDGALATPSLAVLLLLPFPEQAMGSGGLCGNGPAAGLQAVSRAVPAHRGGLVQVLLPSQLQKQFRSVTLSNRGPRRARGTYSPAAGLPAG